MLFTSDHRQVNVYIVFIAGKGTENMEISKRILIIEYYIAIVII
jgi:hypothetical protein